MERTIQSSFLRNMAVIKKQLEDKTRAKDNSEIINKVITSLKSYNDDIINIPTGDIAELFSLDNEKDTITYSENTMRLIKADCMNILSFNDINFIILQESVTNTLLKSYCSKQIEKELAASLNKVFTFDMINPSIDNNLLNRCGMVLG
jgi:hypothetical protein